MDSQYLEKRVLFGGSGWWWWWDVVGGTELTEFLILLRILKKKKHPLFFLTTISLKTGSFQSPQSRKDTNQNKEWSFKLNKLGFEKCTTWFLVFSFW